MSVTSYRPLKAKGCTDDSGGGIIATFDVNSSFRGINQSRRRRLRWLTFVTQRCNINISISRNIHCMKLCTRAGHKTDNLKKCCPNLGWKYSVEWISMSEFVKRNWDISTPLDSSKSDLHYVKYLIHKTKMKLKSFIFAEMYCVVHLRNALILIPSLFSAYSFPV